MSNASVTDIELPGLDCGLCGYRSCTELAAQLDEKPDLLKRCIPLAADFMSVQSAPQEAPAQQKRSRRAERSPVGSDKDETCRSCDAATACATAPAPLADTTASETAEHAVPKDVRVMVAARTKNEWQDHLGRDYDFVLEHFPEEPGPREQIVPHNPLITRELEIEPGEILIGRPLGISCGCPITHCGIVQTVDMFTGAIVWCVTGPLHPRQHGFKDIGYYSAQAYEGLIKKQRVEVEIGKRYWFQPRMCMMQWRHSGLVNFINRGEDGLQVRIEGLWIG